MGYTVNYYYITDVDFWSKFGYNKYCKLNIVARFLWGRKGFDGDFEHGGASSGGHHLKSLNFKYKS